MQGAKVIKYQYFRGSKSWEEMANEVCQWVNLNISLLRIQGIASVLCHYDNTIMVNLYYNDGLIPKDILDQSNGYVLTYHVFRNKRTMLHSWKVHNQKMLKQIGEIANRGTILAINNLQYDQGHEENLTVVWYKRMK